MTHSMFVAIAGIALVAFGATTEFLTSRRYTEQHVVANAGTCKIDVTVLEGTGAPVGPEVGTVVLFHGLAANKMVMRYLARAFAEQGLRVYIPDLPGHGRSAGPFTPDQAEACGLSFVRGLAARGFIRPERTILAGHSMGAAIALRVAAKFRPAGVVAISPAPMQTAHGLAPEVLLFHNFPELQPNTLIMVGRFEPEWMKGNAEELTSTSNDPTVGFAVIPLGTHVGVLFSPTVARMAQEWAAKVLQLPEVSRLPTRIGLLGGLWGLLGILLIAGPFIREAVGEQTSETAEVPASSSERGQHHPLRLAVEFILLSLAVVLLLRYWVPLRPLRLFEGNYLASFLLLAGLIIVLLHAKTAQAQFKVKATVLLGAALAADLWRDRAAQRSNPAFADVTLLCAAIYADGDGCTIGTQEQRLCDSRRGLRCYTVDRFLSGAFSGLLAGHHRQTSHFIPRRDDNRLCKGCHDGRDCNCRWWAVRRHVRRTTRARGQQRPHFR
jgi:pimeloyl-ACP methyl ester carboxylesterase